MELIHSGRPKTATPSDGTLLVPLTLEASMAALKHYYRDLGQRL